MIGDRMDTDIVAGIEAGLHTILVLTGISDQAEIERYPFRPDDFSGWRGGAAGRWAGFEAVR